MRKEGGIRDSDVGQADYPGFLPRDKVCRLIRDRAMVHSSQIEERNLPCVKKGQILTVQELQSDFLGIRSRQGIRGQGKKSHFKIIEK